MKSLFATAVAALLLPTAALAADRDQPLDAEVTTSDDNKTRLKSSYGKPVLRFYGDPDSVRLNQPAKDALAKVPVLVDLTGGPAAET